MSIKSGIPLSEAGLVDQEQSRTAAALSLTTVDELSDFLQLFPAAAEQLFPGLDLTEIGVRAGPMRSSSSVAAIDSIELTLLETSQGLGALAPAAILEDQVAELEYELLDAVPDAAEADDSDEPKVRLDCFGPIRDQGTRGTCVAHTVCALLECELGGGQGLDLSEQFLYWMCKLNDGAPAASGTWQRVAVPLALRYGVCDETDWAYNPVPLASENQGPPPPGAQAAAMAHRGRFGKALDPTWVEGICAELDEHHPVGVSVPVFANRTLAQLSGDFPMPLPNSTPAGGHAMCVIGYGYDTGFLGGGYLIVRNSWGTTWGSESPFGPGHGTLPFGYVQKYGWEAFTISGPSR